MVESKEYFLYNYFIDFCIVGKIDMESVSSENVVISLSSIDGEFDDVSDYNNLWLGKKFVDIKVKVEVYLDFEKFDEVVVMFVFFYYLEFCLLIMFLMNKCIFFVLVFWVLWLRNWSLIFI